MPTNRAERWRMSKRSPVEFTHSHDPDTKEDYGNTERLDPSDARRFIEDLVQTMQKRAWEEHNKEGSSIQRAEDLPSEAKQLYGDTWTFIYGISSGMALMNAEHEKEFDWENGEEIDHGISGDDSWQEHYDQYGYGTYGRGLKIGKRLAFYEDRNFTFGSNESQTDSTESAETQFEIRSYD